jgi:ABC-type phosphate transport system substrate-binding protein
MRWKLRQLKTALLGGILSICLAMAPQVQAEPIVVVVNGKAPVQQLTGDEIKAIYLGEQGYWGQTKIRPISYRSPRGVQSDFLRRIVQINPANYAKYWIHRIFREGGVPPATADSRADLLRTVANQDGAIGFLFAADLPDNPKRVKTVYRSTD